MSSSQNLSRELSQTRQELKDVREQIQALYARKRQLEVKIDNLEQRAANASSQSIQVSQSREEKRYKWSDRVQEVLKNVFKLKAFRSCQERAINTTLEGKDCLVVMPTGGGKSLCFQLPALVNDGITVVVSPLLSLMEDQVNGLKALDIETSVINGNTPLKETNEIMRAMVDRGSSLKIIYVTPEKVAKSKRFMAEMEKCYNANRLDRIVIDEVHCCSQWGHDFRPDYKFLGVMKKQFPNTPILGLTATATATVIKDIQKILSIEGCLVLKDSFFRPNLNYVIERLGIYTKREQLIERIALLLKTKYDRQSGIIYCLSIKDVEEVTAKLISLGVRAGAYHAQLPPTQKTQIHKEWHKNRCQVIVATIAFGMGINKLDVRFIIHFSMSKSVESYYQETGRAGRDGQPADCILFYKFADVFRATSIVFNETNGLTNVYSMVGFCLNDKTCRKEQIAVYFGDNWNNRCEGKCDNCQSVKNLSEVNVSKYLDDLISIIKQAKGFNERLTAIKLIDAWCSKGTKKLRLEGIDPPAFSKEVCQQIIGLLLVDTYLKEEFHYTAYSTVSYLNIGPRALCRPKNGKITYFLNCHQIPQLPTSTATSTSSSSSKSSKTKAYTPKYNSSEFMSIKKTKKSNGSVTKTGTTFKATEQTSTKRDSDLQIVDDFIDDFPDNFDDDFNQDLSSAYFQNSVSKSDSSPEFSRSEITLDSDPIPSHSDTLRSKFSRIESSSDSSCSEFTAVVKTKRKRLRIESDDENNDDDLVCLD